MCFIFGSRPTNGGTPAFTEPSTLDTTAPNVGRLRLQKLRQRQPAQAEGADPDEVAPRHAVAKAARVRSVGEEGEHQRIGKSWKRESRQRSFHVRGPVWRATAVCPLPCSSPLF